MSEFQWLPPLDIKCTSADCENELHCFKQLKKMTEEQRGKCRYCGADLVDWDRLHLRDVGDVAYTFAALKNEIINDFETGTTFFTRRSTRRRFGTRSAKVGFC